MTHAQYINELLERIDCLKRVNDEQAAVLTSCQDEYEILNERFANLERCHGNQARTIQAQENQNRELVRRVAFLEDLQEDRKDG